MVNNVAAAHLEGFGSIDGVKQAKGEIYQGLAAGGIAIVNLDSNGGAKWDEVLADKNVITFSQSNADADFFASNIVMSAAGEASFDLHIAATSQEIELSLGIIGQHNVPNAIAASIIALKMGATLEDIQAGLKHLNKVKGRVEVEELSDKIKLIDDSYNASVPAMKAAVDLLAAFQGQRWLILGRRSFWADFRDFEILGGGGDIKNSISTANYCNGPHIRLLPCATKVFSAWTEVWTGSCHSGKRFWFP